jgi:arylsulfatase A-like enzyme
VIVLALDDMDSASVGAMPKLLSLIADRGVNLLYSYATLPLCSPARATFFTGQYTHNHRVTSNIDYAEVRATGIEGSNLATWLKGAGYFNAMLGKYYNNYPSGSPETFIPQGWDEWLGVLEDRTVDNIDWEANDNGRIISYRDTGQATYQTDVLADRAVDVIRRVTDRPIFMLIAPSSPHLPSTPATRHEGMFAGHEAPRTPSFNEADVSDKPFWLRTRPLINDLLVRQIDIDYRKRLEALQAVDELVEKIINALQAAGKLDNSYFIFTSDNGVMQGQHRLRGKHAPYEESISIPMMIRGPRVAAGARRNHLVGQIDLNPTICEMAGIPIPSSVDGRSLMPLLGDAPPAPSAWRQELLIELFGGGPNIPPYGAVRAERPDGGSYLYVEYDANSDREFYDLRRDPDQLTNTYDGSDASIVGPLQQRLQVLRGCRGATCR